MVVREGGNALLRLFGVIVTLRRRVWFIVSGWVAQRGTAGGGTSLATMPFDDSSPPVRHACDSTHSTMKQGTLRRRRWHGTGKEEEERGARRSAKKEAHGGRREEEEGAAKKELQRRSCEEERGMAVGDEEGGARWSAIGAKKKELRRRTRHSGRWKRRERKKKMKNG
ncbi:hypothetical protein L484_014985 [Morus notabilis]|uniref:Uncharacterized protein n=1 Tax=Morus notabilis TaxID=981085 RepID=W9SIC8_9ROSA|nr:hypothetical protein L484_014985 [Morus notabilis]